jgi:hypothetical protein
LHYNLEKLPIALYMTLLIKQCYVTVVLLELLMVMCLLSMSCSNNRVRYYDGDAFVLRHSSENKSNFCNITERTRPTLHQEHDEAT